MVLIIQKANDMFAKLYLNKNFVPVIWFDFARAFTDQHKAVNQLKTIENQIRSVIII